MSCDVALSAALLLAALHPAPASHADPARSALLWRVAVTTSAPASNPLASEPLFSDIVRSARRLKDEVETFRKGAAPPAQARMDGFRAGIQALADLDMKGHLELAARGTDGDLKCILRGISQDLPKKLDEMMTAPDPAARDTALRDMAYLLNDNVEVITAPPAPPA